MRKTDNKQFSIGAINNTMSLRLPQYESLRILDDIMQSIDLSDDLDTLQKQIHEKYPIFREFERTFPSLTFSLATGVGKTLLMGAFITYLYTNYGIKHFFVVAPNLTIYNKLIEDFGSPAYRKYVFQRIQPFLQNPPLVITGDTYKQHVAGQMSLQESITINIFNIGKINAEVRGGSVPQVKRLSEYIGESYFDYLAGLSDLVVLMDESHHYRADRGMAVINELSPLLGLELTATPQVETAKGAQKFKNVVYEYSLARAIVDGYVKEPAAATRRSFDPHQYTPEEIDHIKLVDGVRIHRNTKAELAAYAENEGVRLVKPFVLVVCKDTTHAAEIKDYITSPDFFDGEYADKVIEVHSNQKGTEKDENIQKLLSLEEPDNTIEIVIHVNMLKEGWDVTNLYTIIPLRTATSLTLREQTIGRGLRLPYGKRVNNAAVDRLTIVAHDKFEEIIRAASDEESIIRKENIIDIADDEELGREKEIVKPKTVFDDFIEQKKQNLKYARSEEKKQTLQEDIQTAEAVGLAIEELLTKPVNIVVPVAPKAADAEPGAAPVVTIPEQSMRTVITTCDLAKPEIQELIREKAREHLEVGGQLPLDTERLEQKIELAVAPLVEQKVRATIDIPDVVLVRKNTQTRTFLDFDLSTRFLPVFSAPNEEILIESLQDNETTTLREDGGFVLPDTVENVLLGTLTDLDMGLPMHRITELCYKLIGQLLAHTCAGKTKEETERIVWHYKKELAGILLDQLRAHVVLSEPEYEMKLLRASSPILQQDYTKFKEDEIVKYTADIPAYEIKKKVVGHFSKACHTAYKFDSRPEHIFSIMLERSNCVEKWLRPATGQFKIHWKGPKLYEPDFVVETADAIYIVEIKASNRTQDEEVQAKAKAARAYCDNVNAIFGGTGRKEWKYMLLLDSEVTRSADFADLEREVEWYRLG